MAVAENDIYELDPAETKLQMIDLFATEMTKHFKKARISEIDYTMYQTEIHTVVHEAVEHAQLGMVCQDTLKEALDDTGLKYWELRESRNIFLHQAFREPVFKNLFATLGNGKKRVWSPRLGPYNFWESLD